MERSGHGDSSRFASVRLCLLCLGVILDAPQLTAPVPRERAGPFVDRSQRVGVGAVERSASVAAHVDEPDVEQHLQMFRHRRLREPERDRDVADRALFGPRYSRISRRRGSATALKVSEVVEARGTTAIIFPYRNMSSSTLYTGPSAKGRFQSAERAVPTLRQLQPTNLLSA